MSGKARINWPTLDNPFPFGGPLGSIAVAIALCASGGFVIHDLETGPFDAARPRLQNFASPAFDGNIYRINGPAQIVTEQGEYTYTFNYRANQVIIAKGDDNDPIDFKNFSNPEMIKYARGQGCMLSNNFVTSAENYLDDAPDNRRYLQEDMQQAAFFKENVCKPAP